METSGEANADAAAAAAATVEPEPVVAETIAAVLPPETAEAAEPVSIEAVAAELMLAEPELVVAEPVVAEPVAEPVVAEPAPIAADAAPLPPTVEGRAATGATRTSDLLHRFRPGQSIDDELAAYEAELDRRDAVAELAEPAVEPRAAADEAETGLAVVALPETAEPIRAEAAVVEEPVAELAAAEIEPAPSAPIAAERAVFEPEPTAPVAEPVVELVVAATEPELEPAPEPVAEPAPERVAASADPTAPEPVRDDRIEQPTWQIYAPDAAPSLPDSPGVVAPSTPSQPGSGPQWPVRPDEAESPAMALLASRRNGPSDAGLWAASAQEVLATPPAGARPGAAVTGVQPCSNCGLSLSATARFCRRCGTRQG